MPKNRKPGEAERGPINMAVRAMDDDSVELDIFDAIGAMFWGITTKDVARVLKAHRGKAIHVRINSPGGEANDGCAIYNLLAGHDGPVTVTVLGVAASAASVIAMAGKPLRMAANALLMIHDPWVDTFGNADQLRRDADMLDKDAAALATTYSQRTGKDAEEVRDLMRAETWFTAEQAIAEGFADETIEMPAVAACVRDDHLKIWRNGVPARAKALLQPARAGSGKWVFDAAPGTDVQPARDFRALADGVSFSEVRDALAAELQRTFGDSDERLWVYPVDVYDDTVVYDVGGECFIVTYSFDAETGNATLVGDPRRVRRQWQELEASVATNQPAAAPAAPAAVAQSTKPIVAAGDQHPGNTMPILNKLLKISDDADEATVTAAFNKIKEAADVAGDLERLTGCKGAEAVGTVRAWKQASESHDELKGQVAELKASNDRRDFDEVVKSGLASKQLTPATADLYRNRFNAALREERGHTVTDDLRGFLAVAPRFAKGGFVAPTNGDGDITALTYQGKSFAELKPIERHQLKQDTPALYDAMRESALQSGQL